MNKSDWLKSVIGIFLLKTSYKNDFTSLVSVNVKSQFQHHGQLHIHPLTAVLFYCFSVKFFFHLAYVHLTLSRRERGPLHFFIFCFQVAELSCILLKWSVAIDLQTYWRCFDIFLKTLTNFSFIFSIVLLSEWVMGQG